MVQSTKSSRDAICCLGCARPYKRCIRDAPSGQVTWFMPSAIAFVFPSFWQTEDALRVSSPVFVSMSVSACVCFPEYSACPSTYLPSFVWVLRATTPQIACQKIVLGCAKADHLLVRGGQTFVSDHAAKG